MISAWQVVAPVGTVYGGLACGYVFQVFVTGCHRSGTSLGLLDAWSGDRSDPRQRRGDLELKLENPLAESERLVEINDGLLKALGCQWDVLPFCLGDQSPLLDSLQLERSRLESYALEHAWVDKDPRLCITYPAYLHILLRCISLWPCVTPWLLLPPCMLAMGSASIVVCCCGGFITTILFHSCVLRICWSHTALC